MPADVTVKVFEGSNRLLEGKRHTVAIGANLHIVAVTATTQPPAAELREGVIYSYDLLFDFEDGRERTLPEATRNALLAYEPFTHPTFCLPPRNINQLRLICGSCRIPHGNGPDTLPLLDELIAQAAQNPMARPHQLLLMGDQIYADDVGFSTSVLLSDAGQALLGWTEEFICNHPSPNTQRKVTELHPGFRAQALVNDAGFTSEDVKCHLIGLGEFLAMYLFVWSDALWPPASDMPTFDEIQAFFTSRTKPGDMVPLVFLLTEADRKGITDQTE